MTVKRVIICEAAGPGADLLCHVRVRPDGSGVLSCRRRGKSVHESGVTPEFGFGAALAAVLVVMGLLISFLLLRLFPFTDLVAEPRIEIT